MVAGASMVFSAPKIQWVQVLQRLDISAETDDDNLCETIVSQSNFWNGLIFGILSFWKYQLLWSLFLSNPANVRVHSNLYSLLSVLHKWEYEYVYEFVYQLIDTRAVYI